ncbi:IniB N-terminal domain-containing protein [Agromyces sp. NPDC058484]|uniref:IniB N-terminal domain-containing protein n=1 Tax=Agromyces sp. NPDC058484 TaxID=3346524 RepID=UPI00365E3242
MNTPVATIADALIAFILSLLRDPAAVEEFNAEPQAMMASNGLQGACAADVKAVAPVIIDHPAVTPKPDGPADPPASGPSSPPDEVIKEISRIVNQFTTIDNRSTIIDQSTNQNIWAQGDVTQIFDQEANVAVGDGSVAAGNDADVDNSDNEVTVGGDVSVGNTTGSHNTTTTGTPPDVAAGTPPEAPVDPAAGTGTDPATDAVTAGTEAASAAADAATGTVEQAAPAPEPEPLMTDLTAADSYDTGETLTAPEPEPYPEEMAEEQ